MKKVYGINGSPRKTWNTAILLEHALKGAAKMGADTELIHLYDLDFKGCRSCFACKLKNGKSYGKCAVKDGLTPVLEKLAGAQALILGSPIYFGTVTGEIRSFMERLLFPYLAYTMPASTLFDRKLPTAFIYTMNLPEQQTKERNYQIHFGTNEEYLTKIFGQAETLCCYETLQIEDYSKIVFNYYDTEQRRKRRTEVFPEDCKKAFDLGIRLVSTDKD